MISSNQIIILFIFILTVMKIDGKLEVKFLTAVFRHGDRAPDDDDTYPNDPYKNYNFAPEGRGGLTNEGKEREYNLGRVLRELYGNFLGDIYSPLLVNALSDDIDRTKMSLQLVMAGLFEPKNEQIWNYKLNWQPTVVNSVPSFFDSLLDPIECYQFEEELDRVIESPEFKERLDKFSNFMKSLSEWTGKSITSAHDMEEIYKTLMAERACNLTLPQWTHGIFPNGLLLDGAVLSFESLSYNTKLNRLNGGMLLRNITKSMLDVTRNRMKNGRKVNLFSGHEGNVAAFLNALGVYTPHVPEYSSAVLVELLGDSEGYYVRVRYYKGIPAETIVMKIPGCDELCPFKKFREIMEPVIPSDEELICSKESLASLVKKIYEKFNYKLSSLFLLK